MKADRTNTAVLFSVLILLATVESAQACSCASSTVQERFVEADYVFTAKVIGHRVEGEKRTHSGHPDDTTDAKSQVLEIEFDPLVDHKGDSSQIVYLRTSQWDMSCGVDLTLGQVYTFFVAKGAYIGSCGSVLSKKEESEFLELVRELDIESAQ